MSFDPTLTQRYAWVHGWAPNHPFASAAAAVEAILAAAPERSVNIRSFEPENPKSREFLYGRTASESILIDLQRLAGDGLYTIVNETVDVNDGGVSGVAYGDVIEFAPGDTPRCVEKPGTAAFPRRLGMRLFETVYGFRPTLPDRAELRVEFSLHPLRRGYRHDHTIIWEMEEPGPPPAGALPAWPNRFSRWIGDKAFGLLVADLIGLDVPRTTVVSRRVAPFSFGRDTGVAESWIRTCPAEQMPGKLTTRRGWLDPFRLLHEEDPTGEMVPSVLAQQGVNATFSGALNAQLDGEVSLEGVSGYGDDFMVGRRAPEDLPERVVRDVQAVYRLASDHLGPVRFEWVHDDRSAWVVQLHRGATPSAGRVIFPGESLGDHVFPVTEGIDALRTLIDRVKGTGEGIVLVGQVGVTSHFGDLLRHARIPSRIEPPGESAAA